MNHAIKIIFITILSVMCILVPLQVFAADIEIDLSADEVSVGDEISLIIDVNGKNMAIAEGFFSYDHNLLTYKDSSGGATDGTINIVSTRKGGTSSMTVVIEFTAIAKGEVEIAVAFDKVISYDGEIEQLEPEVTVVKILADQAAPVVNEVINKDPFIASEDSVIASKVYGTDLDMFVWKSVQNLTLPSGFTDQDIEYNGQIVGGAISNSDGNILLYVSEGNGENGEFYYFSENENVLYPFIKARAVGYAYTLISPNGEVSPPDGFIQTVLTYDGKKIPAWTKEGADETAYLVYAKNSSGGKGIYQYVPEDQTIQRFVDWSFEETKQVVSKAGQQQLNGIGTNVFISIIIVMSLFIVLSIVLAILYVKALKINKKAITVRRRNMY